MDRGCAMTDYPLPRWRICASCGDYHFRLHPDPLVMSCGKCGARRPLTCPKCNQRVVRIDLRASATGSSYMRAVCRCGHADSQWNVSDKSKRRRVLRYQALAFLIYPGADAGSVGKCARCGSQHPASALEVDHVRSLAHGGLDVLENMQLLCHACHDDKTRRDFPGWRPLDRR